MYLVRDLSAAAVESLWTVAGWIARDKKRSRSEITWLEDSVRLHWNGPDSVDQMTNTKVFDGADHVLDWTSLWRHKLVISQEDVDDRRERGLKNATRQHRSNEGRKVVLQAIQREKRVGVRTLLHISQGADPALVGASSRRAMDTIDGPKDLTQLELLDDNSEEISEREEEESIQFVQVVALPIFCLYQRLGRPRYAISSFRTEGLCVLSNQICTSALFELGEQPNLVQRARTKASPAKSQSVGFRNEADPSSSSQIIAVIAF